MTYEELTDRLHQMALEARDLIRGCDEFKPFDNQKLVYEISCLDDCVEGVTSFSIRRFVPERAEHYTQIADSRRYFEDEEYLNRRAES